MCSQFEMDSACKVEEARCAFPHYVEERTLWTMDRNETFDLKAYLAQLQKSSSKQGKNRKLGPGFRNWVPKFGNCKIFGCPNFEVGPQYTQISTINM